MPRFNPMSDEWQAAVAGVWEMLGRTSQQPGAASHGAPEDDPAEQAPPADTCE